MAVFVVEKDRRMNDEVRMSAVSDSEPEWKVKDGLAKCHELELEVARVNSTLEGLDGMDRQRTAVVMATSSFIDVRGKLAKGALCYKVLDLDVVFLFLSLYFLSLVAMNACLNGDI